MNKVFRINKDIGLQINLYGVFVATQEEIDNCIGKRLKLNIDIEKNEIVNEKKFKNVIVRKKDIKELDFVKYSFMSTERNVEYYSRFSMTMDGMLKSFVDSENIKDYAERETFRVANNKDKTLQGFNLINQVRKQTKK